MKKYIRSTAILALAFLFSFTADTWKVYNSKNGHYKVSMPGIPEEASGNANSEFGPQVLHNASLMLQTDGVKLFIASYADYPVKPTDPKITKEHAEKLIARTVNSFVRSMGGTIVLEEPISYKGSPGKHAKVKVESKDIIFEISVFIVGIRTYMLATGYDANVTNTAAATQFFNSFQITP